MAFPPPASPSLSSPEIMPLVHLRAVTDEEFMMYHIGDYQLFKRIVSLGHNLSDSMQVMAFWMWLERASYKFFIHNISTFSSQVIANLFNETILCLKSAKSDNFPYPDGHYNDIPLLQSVTGIEISLKYFHDIRGTVLNGVRKMIRDVCMRVFRDIIQKAQAQMLGVGGEKEAPVAQGGAFSESACNYGYSQTYNNYDVPEFSVPLDLESIQGGIAGHRSGGSLSVNDPRCGSYTQEQVLHGELAELLCRLRVNDPSEAEEKQVPPDERTIFLTFSKGYPIQEDEVQEFFTQTFGEVIEALYMQDVSKDEQALYARLVVHKAEMMEWGKFIANDDSTSKMIRFDVACILISTPYTATISSTISVAVDDSVFPIRVNEEPFSDGCISFTSYKFVHHSSRPSVSPSGFLGSSSRSRKSSASKELIGTSAGSKGAGLPSPRVSCLQHHSDTHDEPSVSSHVTPIIHVSDSFIEPSVSLIQETPSNCLLDQHLSPGPSGFGPQNSHPSGPRTSSCPMPSGHNNSGPISSGHLLLPILYNPPTPNKPLSQFQNMNRILCNSDGVQLAKEAWDFLSQLALSSKGKDEEMIRRLEDMEAIASG
ncbi:hypothetical protein Ancab_001411 [Ancistrocladus abbreviatus]